MQCLASGFPLYIIEFKKIQPLPTILLFMHQEVFLACLAVSSVSLYALKQSRETFKQHLAILWHRISWSTSTASRYWAPDTRQIQELTRSTPNFNVLSLGNTFGINTCLIWLSSEKTETIWCIWKIQNLVWRLRVKWTLKQLKIVSRSQWNSHW